MAATKMWAHRLIVAVGVVAFGSLASGAAYHAAGAATSLGSLAFSR